MLQKLLKKKKVTNFKLISLDAKDMDVEGNAANKLGVIKLCYIKSRLKSTEKLLLPDSYRS